MNEASEGTEVKEKLIPSHGALCMPLLTLTHESQPRVFSI